MDVKQHRDVLLNRLVAHLRGCGDQEFYELAELAFGFDDPDVQRMWEELNELEGGREAIAEP